MVSLIFLVLAFFLTLIAAFLGPPAPLWWRLPRPGWLGVSFYFFSLILRTAGVQ